MVVDPTSRSLFFVGAAVGLAGWPCFFVGAVVGLVVGLSGADGLAIGEALSTEADVAVSFSGLFFW